MGEARPTVEERATKRGADDLMALAEWALRCRPRALRLARQRYLSVCVYLYRTIARATRERP